MTSFDPSNEVRTSLRRIYREHGAEGLDRIEFVGTAWPGDAIEDRLVRAAAECGVAAMLNTRIASGIPLDAAMRAVVLHLAARCGLDLVACDWVVYEYALALGHVSEYPTISGGLPTPPVAERTVAPGADGAVPDAPRPTPPSAPGSEYAAGSPDSAGWADSAGSPDSADSAEWADSAGSADSARPADSPGQAARARDASDEGARITAAPAAEVETPAYQAPDYEPPPAYEPPAYQAPEYQAPDYQAPAYQAPGFDAEDDTPTGFDRPSPVIAAREVEPDIPTSPPAPPVMPWGPPPTGQPIPAQGGYQAPVQGVSGPPAADPYAQTPPGSPMPAHGGNPYAPVPPGRPMSPPSGGGPYAPPPPGSPMSPPSGGNPYAPPPPGGGNPYAQGQGPDVMAQSAPPTGWSGSGGPTPAEVAVKREMRRGVLAVNAADRMHQGRKERVEVGIARTGESAPEMVASLTAAPRLSAEVNTADYMQLELVGEGFAITPLSPKQQLVVPTARWDFDVVPLSAGEQSLSVIGTCWFTVDGQERALAVPAFVRMVNVEVDNAYRLKRALAGNWQWIIGTILGLGGSIAAWIALFG